MLRTAGARGVKTTNFDACRDLNGRRLRHVNAEAKLREWDMQAEERKLKQQQQQAMNAKPGPAPIARFDDEEYEDMLEGARSRVTDALAAASANADGAASSSAAPVPSPAAEAEGACAASLSGTAKGKRKVEPEAAAGPTASAKAAKLWADPLEALQGGDDSSSDSGDSQQEA